MDTTWEVARWALIVLGLTVLAAVGLVIVGLLAAGLLWIATLVRELVRERRRDNAQAAEWRRTHPRDDAGRWRA